MRAITAARSATSAALAAAVAAVALAGCGADPAQAGSGATTQAPGTTQAPSATAKPSPAAEPAKPKATPNAGAIAREMRKRSGGHIRSLWVYTEANDPNDLIGRPHAYTSATFMEDDRVRGHSARPDEMNGAQVEQFASAADAERRRKYIDGVYESMPILGAPDYQTVVGRTLLRVSGKLTPSINRGYVAEFRAVLAG